MGPPHPSTVSHIQISPLGLVPKSHSDRWRMIVALLSPCGRSVNDGISSELCSLRYASVDNALEVIMSLGCLALLAKFDLPHAYCIIPVHPDDQSLLRVAWQGRVYMDRSMPFG